MLSNALFAVGNVKSFSIILIRVYNIQPRSC